jgi:Ca-activated chloride channel family protein
MQTRPRSLPSLAAAILALAPLAPTQHQPQAFAPGSWLVVPQLRSMAFDPARHAAPVTIEAVRARITILDRSATTELQVDLRNPSPRDAEAVLLLPVPRGAAVSSFAFDGAAAESTARLLPQDEARRTYDEIVRRLRDPALLEFAGEALVRSSVFPVPGGGTQRVRLRYEHLLEQVGDRVDYLLPRSDSLDPAAPWQVEVSIRAGRTITTAFSPSHPIEQERAARDRLTVRLAAAGRQTPGAFRLSWLLQAGAAEPSASLLAYPDPVAGGGYFLLMAGLPPIDPAARAHVRRELTLVLDRSGSMAGGKIDQVRAAALQVIEGLEAGERFQIFDYATDVARFAEHPVPKAEGSVKDARAYLAALRPGGGTNLHDALVEALRAEPTAGVLPIVLFLTDGLPTVGTTTEVGIRQLVEQGNPHGRRVFTFGVGPDVNAPLLDRVAEVSRATATYVLPEEDVELKVARVFAALHGPVLCDLELATLDEAGAVDTRRVREPMPRRLPDLFENDQLVLLGRYEGEEPLRFRLRGRWLGEPRVFAFTFGVDRASTHNAFVPRLWASRRIAELVDQVRQAGADRGPGAADPFADPKLRELRDEILALSTRFGVLSEYTAFLATEGTDLRHWGALAASCAVELDQKAIRTRSGLPALNQAFNIQNQKAQNVLNPRNVHLDAAMNPVQFTNVQQVCDRAFFRTGGRWIDSRLIEGGAFEPDRTLRRGSPEHEALLQRLLGLGQSALLSLRGETLLQVDGERILVVDGD